VDRIDSGLCSMVVFCVRDVELLVSYTIVLVSLLHANTCTDIRSKYTNSEFHQAEAESFV
jgi:hypothetical protein